MEINFRLIQKKWKEYEQSPLRRLFKKNLKDIEIKWLIQEIDKLYHFIRKELDENKIAVEKEKKINKRLVKAVGSSYEYSGIGAKIIQDSINEMLENIIKSFDDEGHYAKNYEFRLEEKKKIDITEN